MSGTLSRETSSCRTNRLLVVARRTGSVSNAMLRDVSGLDILAASNQLRQLRDEGLLEPRGKGSAPHYVLGSRARPLAGGPEPQKGGLPEQKGELPPDEEAQSF